MILFCTLAYLLLQTLAPTSSKKYLENRETESESKIMRRQNKPTRIMMSPITFGVTLDLLSTSIISNLFSFSSS